ncbi:hypothetical protein CBR_g41746 [Chara braunii]|uniref:PTM/DIR17-like Tudor domain-containing protein n=1 Tax=Chara braunii TaxID=69332 RepID=A0A388LWP9_CHABU|nr:hypothetical protein CBR_g41746 [Chara braunii]|eukprot:GBG86683.1 hypothetical protein CBR_g41746 [Chara braunii]
MRVRPESVEVELEMTIEPGEEEAVIIGGFQATPQEEEEEEEESIVRLRLGWKDHQKSVTGMNMPGVPCGALVACSESHQQESLGKRVQANPLVNAATPSELRITALVLGVGGEAVRCEDDDDSCAAGEGTVGVALKKAMSSGLGSPRMKERGGMLRLEEEMLTTGEKSHKALRPKSCSMKLELEPDSRNKSCANPNSNSQVEMGGDTLQEEQQAQVESMMATTDAGEGIRDPQAMAVGGVAGERDKGEGSVAATSLDDGSQGRQGSGVKEKEIGKGVGEGCVEKEEVRKQAAALERQKEGGAAAHDAEQSDTVEKGSDRRGESTADAEEGEFGGGQKLIGRKTSKKFGRRTFVGEVMSFDEEHKWYKVIYEDGDEEELEWLELKPTLQSVGQGSSLMAPTSSIEMPLGKRKRKESARLTECLNQFGSLSFTIPRTRGKNKGKGKDNPEKSESEKQSQATQEVGKETPKVVGEVAVEEKKESGKTAMVEEVVVIEENDGEDGDGTDREQKVEENVAAEDAVAVKAQPKGSGKAGAKEEAKPVNKGGLKKSTGKGKEKTVEQKVKKGEKRKDKEKDAGNGKAGEKGTKDVAVQNHAQKRQKTGEKEKQGGEKRKKPMADVQKSPAELSQKPLKKDKKSEEKSTSKPADKASAGAVAENGKEKAKKPGGEGEKSAQQVKKKQVEKPKSVSQKGGGESTVKASKTPTKGAKLEKKKAKSSDKATDVEEVAVEPRQKAGEAGEKGKAQGEKRVSPSDKAKQTQSTNKKSADKNGAQKDSKPAGKVEKAPLLSEKGHKKKDKGDGDDVNTTPDKRLLPEECLDGGTGGLTVKYEDGDEEELVWRELEPILIPGTSTAVKEKETVSAPAQSGKKKGQGNVTAKSKSSSPTTVEGSGEGGSSSSLKRKRAHGENGTNDNKPFLKTASLLKALPNLVAVPSTS